MAAPKRSVIRTGGPRGGGERLRRAPVERTDC
jgi:hypothetical protein